MKTIVVANQKGGVGKTTTILMLASLLGEKNKKVLVLDCDSQHNTTKRLEEDNAETQIRLFDLFQDEESSLKASSAILKAKTDFKNVYYIEGDSRLAKIDSVLSNRISREKTLRKIIEPLKKHFDFILIDTPPAINALTINALTAADELIIPCDFSLDSFDGAKILDGLVNRLNQEEISKVKLKWVLICGAEKTHSKLHRNLTKLMRDEFKDKYFESSIPATVKVGESALLGGVPHLMFPDHPVTKSYKNFTNTLFT